MKRHKKLVSTDSMTKWQYAQLAINKMTTQFATQAQAEMARRSEP